MTAGPHLQRVVLLVHIVASVGWMGGAFAFLAFGLVGLTSADEPTVRGVYLVMEPAAWFVLVPLAGLALTTGIIESFITPWGLVRHYWVVFKLLITLFATMVLLLYMNTFRILADAARDPNTALGTVRNASPVLHASLALALLLVATVLAVYKPHGLTPYGARRPRPQ